MLPNDRLPNRHSRLGEKLTLKSGVSLVTVLLFMLVATIAATATYKWLTSENRSSGSRLLRQEAYQSSVAGIENARTWMTFHANDVGALIKAYIDGGRNPINLDARLRPLQKAGQNYHVWLTGVNTENSTFKLKIMSSGEAPNNTRHSETAIYNVDGLYQVKVPHEKVVATVPFEHNYFGGSTHSKGTVKAYSLMINGNLEGTNPVYTDADLIVTGNVNVTGSSVGAGRTTCVGGNFDANNGVLGKDFYIEGNASHFSFPTTSEAAKLTNANVTGDVYIGGNLNAPSTGNQQFQKSLSIMGKWKTNLGAHEASVAGNLCVGENGQVEINSTGRTFRVDGNVWSEALYPIWWTGGPEQDHNKYNKIILGNKTDSKVYVSSGMSSSEYATLRNNRAFVESRYYYRGTAGGAGTLTWDARTYYPYQNVPAAEDKYCLYKYTGPGQDVDFIVKTSPWGMGGTISYANYYVENEVFYTPTGFGFMPGPGGVTGQNHLLNMQGNTPTGSPYCKAAPDKWRPECKATPWFKSNGQVKRNFSSTDKVKCAEDVRDYCKNILGEQTTGCYGSKYKIPDILVTAFSKFEPYANKGCANVTTWGDNLSKNLNACYAKNSAENPDNLYNGYQVVKVTSGWLKNPKTPLKGKFIIIVTNAMGQQNLPPTTEDSYALLYLMEGQTGDAIQPAVNSGFYNYFIYTKKDIKQFMFNNADFTGSIYAAVDPNCAKVGNFQTRSMIYNEALMKDLASNGVVCAASVGDACGDAGASSTDPDPSGSGSTTSGTDAYYISMAPQLGVRLESQYKSDEALPAANGTTELTPSFIVLPRVIYLPQDPYGSLPDYYNVQALNGSSLKKSDVTASCSGPGTLSASGTMFEGTALTKGIYTCTASTTVANHASVPFWVVVGDPTRGIPPVSFIEPSHQMDPSEEKEVQISVPVRGAALDIEVYCPDVSDGWSYVEPLPTGVSRTGTTCTVHLEAGAATTMTIFTIKTDNASFGTMSFQIMPGEGYIPGMYATTQLFIASSSILNREDVPSAQIQTYCENNPECPADVTNWTDCSTDAIWVEPSGTSFSKITDNNSWTIMIGNAQPVTLAKPDNFDDCVVIIPSTVSSADNSIPANGVEANKSYTLYASAKKKWNTVKVGFAGDVGSNNNPTIKVILGGSREVDCQYSSADVDGENVKTCTITVYDGESVSPVLQDAGSSEFNYWDCSGASCPTTSGIVSTKEYDSFTISDNATTVLAHFGEKDNHCFFDEFKNGNVTCETDEQYCIDNCASDDIYSTCADLDGGVYPNAKWHLMGGELGQIVVGPSGEIHIDKSVNRGKKESERTAVRVLSTVNAGIQGTLKALVNVPRATASYDKSAANIKNSGFMLRANEYATDYFMLNLYENVSGQLEAQLWRGGTSLSGVLGDENGNPAAVNNYTMVMAMATLTAENTLVLTAYTGNYYGSPTPYTYTFNLNDFNNALADAAHEFVGYSLADPNFKIYGIGWLSDTYNAQCHDTYPTVKCSFAAVAKDGVIPTATSQNSNYIKPWVGYSGWFEANNCTPHYYYYNGSDATISQTDGYSFSEDGRGLHGYTTVENETQTEHKTAKVWLDGCSANNTNVEWSATAEDQRAHCGTFWTGSFTECTAHQDLFSGETPATDGSDATITITEQSLRAATLYVTLENNGGNEVEIWLESKDESAWGNNHVSHSVKMNGNTASFDVLKEFAAGSNGFDPEHVTAIVFRNHGTTSVNVTAVSTTCANAIGITNCRAEYDGTKWNVWSQVTNKEKVSSYQVVAKIENTEILNSSAISSQDIVWNGEIATWSIEDDPFVHPGAHYVFVATVKGTGTQEESKNCAVSPDPIGTPTVNCSVIGSIASGAQYPTFSIDFSGCSGNGCGYEVYLQDVQFTSGVGKTSARHAKEGSETCTLAEGCPRTYTVKSTDGKFADCSATFTILRNSEDIPPSVTCGISTSQNAFTNDPVFVGNEVYFLARNNESVDKTYNVTLKKGEISLNNPAPAPLKNWSQITNIRSLGSDLAAGNHTYSLYYNGEKICDASVTVTEASDACTISGDRIEGQPLSMRVSGVRSNTQFSWTLGNNSTTIDCDATHCWNNTMKAPAAGGPYTYTVKRGSNTICTGTVSIDPILSCSATPNPVGKGLPYTFTANAAVRCTNCIFTNDAGATENNIVVSAGGSWTKTRTPNSLGDKTPGLSCSTCDNNVNASCTVPLKVVTPKPVFECSETLIETVGKDNNVKLRLVGIVGCDNGSCDYLISGTNADGVYHNSGCGNSSCNLPSITNKTKTDGQTDTYQVSLRNSAGETTKNCEVTFTAGPTITCSCVSVCGEGCQTKIKTSSLNNVAYTGCMFFKDISTLQFDNYELNGTAKTGQFCWNNAEDCATKLSAIDKIDGGYYVKVENQTGYMIVGTEAEDPCEGSEPDNPVTGPVIITVASDIPNYYDPSQEEEYENGTCFSLVGTWDNCCYHPTPSLNCRNVSGNGMTYSYNGNPTYKTTQNGNMKENFGVTLEQTTTTTTFINNVCVTSGSGSKIKCKFEN